MARGTIRQRISLDGGKEIQDQLKGLGQAGERAFRQIAGALRLSDADNRLRRLSEAAQRVRRDFQQLGRSLQGFGSSLRSSLSRAATLFAGVSAAALGAAAAVFRFARAGSEAADSAAKAAEAAGLAVDTFSGLQFAAEQSGIDESQFSGAFVRLNQQIANAAEELDKSAAKIGKDVENRVRPALETFNEFGVTVRRFSSQATSVRPATEEASSALVRLGVSVKDANGQVRSSEEVLADLADIFQRMPDGAQKAALAGELFGNRVGPRLLPLLNAGRGGITELVEEAQRAGIVFDEEGARIGTAFLDAMNSLSRSVQGTRNQLGLLFAPTFTEGARLLADVVNNNRQQILRLGEQVRDITIPVIRDLLLLLQGRDAEVQNAWIIEWRDQIVGFGNDVRAVGEQIILPVFRAIGTAAQAVADVLNNVFGREFTARQVLIGTALLQLLGIFRLFGNGVLVVVASLRLLLSSLGFLARLSPLVVAFFNAGRMAAVGFLGAIASVIGWPALVVAGLAAAAVAIYTFWDDIADAAQGAWDRITGLFDWSSLVLSGEDVGRLIVRAWLAQFSFVAGAMRELFDGIVGIARVQLGLIGDLFRNLFSPAVWQEGISNIGAAFGLLGEMIAAQFNNVTVPVIRGALDVVVGLVRGIFSELAQLGPALVDSFANAMTELRALFASAISVIRDGINGLISVVDALVARITAALARLREFFRRSESAPSETGGGRGYASGGFVSGPGTSKSDSIPAWLSNGEFVINAKMTKRFLPLLRMLNSGRLPKGFQIPKFNMGGLVGALDRSMGSLSMPIPKLAMGGLVPASAGRPVNVNFGGETFEMIAPDDVADKLIRFSSKKSVRSAGRRPGWIGQ